MSTPTRTRHVNAGILVIAAAALLAVSGCATMREHFASSPSVTAQREQRHSEALQSFEEHRDKAQLAAAIDRFQQGDLVGCRDRLVTLVERRPALYEARLRLAEVCWGLDDPAAAEQHFQALLEAQPSHAEGHHGLGMLLVAVGRFDEARPHLHRAAELDPENEVYRLASMP